MKTKKFCSEQCAVVMCGAGEDSKPRFRKAYLALQPMELEAMRRRLRLNAWAGALPAGRCHCCGERLAASEGTVSR